MSTPIDTITVVSNEPTPATPAAQSGGANDVDPADAALSGEQSENDEASGASEDEQEEESAEAAEGGEGDEQEEEAEKQPKKKQGGFQKKISKLTKRASLAEQERDYWKEQALKGKPSQEERQEQERNPAPAADDMPNEDDFDSHAEYVRAVARWEVRQELKAEEGKRKEGQAKSQLNERVSKFNQGFQALKHEDASEVLEEAMAERRMSAAVQDLLLDAENGPELSYELAKNVDEWKRINALPPMAAARELGKFEASLTKAQPPKKQPKQITTAPEPINPVGGKGTSAVKKTIYDENLSQAEYEALRDEQERAKRKSA